MKQPFITFREQDENGELQYYILQRGFPHYCGKIDKTPIAGELQATVAGYNMWVSFNFTLRGRMIPSYKDVENEIRFVLEQMAAWFLENRIMAEPKKYKKWLFNQE